MSAQLAGSTSADVLMQPANIAAAVSYSFNNDLATFGKGSDKENRKMLEVIAPALGGTEITAIVEVMPVAQ